MHLRKCRNCGKTFTNKTFCPDCKTLGQIVKEEKPLPEFTLIDEEKARKKPTFTEQEPPAVSTLYCRIWNIPYDDYRENLTKHGENKSWKAIKENYVDFSCKNCQYRTEFFCEKKNQRIKLNACCKQIYPSEELLKKLK